MNIPFDPYDFFGYLASGLVSIVGLELVTGFPHVLSGSLNPVEMALLIIAVYVAGQITAGVAKAILEDIVVAKMLKRPSVNLFREQPPWFGGILFPAFYTPVPKPIRERIIEAARENDIASNGEELFLSIRFSKAVLQNDSLMLRLNGFLNKYGFARNLSFTCIIVGLGVLARDFQTPTSGLKPQWISALVVGVLLFYRYLKFLRQYSFEMFQVYGALNEISHKARDGGAQ